MIRGKLYGLEINVEKTKIMITGTKPHYFQPEIDDQKIQEVQRFKISWTSNNRILYCLSLRGRKNKTYYTESRYHQNFVNLLLKLTYDL